MCPAAYATSTCALLCLWMQGGRRPDNTWNGRIADVFLLRNSPCVFARTGLISAHSGHRGMAYLEAFDIFNLLKLSVNVFCDKL